MTMLQKFRALFRKGKLDAEMADEMRAHLELQIEGNVARGMSPDEARYAALRAFGGVEQIKERARDLRGLPWLEDLLADVRFAVRMLQKRPGFTVAAVLTLALGIGFVTTLFTMINGVAFGQLPFEDSNRIVSIQVSATQFDDYAREQRSCESLAFAQPTSANLRVGARVSRYPTAVVSPNFLDVLRARPAIGRTFLAEDGAAGAPRTALIGHTVWEREFDRAESVTGREIVVNGETCVVIGVMPQGFGFPLNQELWLPRRADEPVPRGIVFGRLRPDVSPRVASGEFTRLSQTLDSEGARAGDFVWNTDRKAETTLEVRPPVEVLPFAQRGVKTALRVMLSAILAATFLVLLLACANVANLMLARAVDRRKEMALRAALGASRGRLVRQMLSESVVIALLGAAGGLAIAGWTTQAVWAYMLKEQSLTGGPPFWINFDVDGRVYAFVAAVALLASVVTGLVPALRASRVDLNNALKDGLGGGVRISRFTRVLMNAQMAFSVCLVTVAGLFVTVLLAFNHKELPYDPRTILTARVSLEEGRYDDRATRHRWFQQLDDRLASTPGIAGAGLTSSDSLRGSSARRIEIEDATYYGGDRPECWTDRVSPSIFNAFGVGLQCGRGFSAADDGAAPPVAIVNSAFVERFGRDIEWLGQRFRFATGNRGPSEWITIVGIAPDLGSVKAGQPSRGAVIYRPLAQEEDRAMTIVLRTGDIATAAATLRREVAALDPELPVARLQTVQEIVELERIGMNSFAVLFIACSFGALLLASVGVYGVISFTVKRRTREFGVRMALGADRKAIARMVFGQGLRQIAIGLGAGALLAVGASTVLSSMFVGFARTGYDAWIYVGVLLVLAAVAGAALMMPARRAAKVDPMAALRAE